MSFSPDRPAVNQNRPLAQQPQPQQPAPAPMTARQQQDYAAMQAAARDRQERLGTSTDSQGGGLTQAQRQARADEFHEQTQQAYERRRGSGMMTDQPQTSRRGQSANVPPMASPERREARNRFTRTIQPLFAGNQQQPAPMTQSPTSMQQSPAFPSSGSTELGSYVDPRLTAADPATDAPSPLRRTDTNFPSLPSPSPRMSPRTEARVSRLSTSQQQRQRDQYAAQQAARRRQSRRSQAPPPQEDSEEE